MKPKSLLSIFLLLILSGSLHAKVIRVNPTEAANPSENTYNNLIFAYNDAVNGDTIYIEPTIVEHGDIIVTKRLVFIGGGYFHDENEGLTSQPYSSLFSGNLVFRLGSSGSKAIGLSFIQGGRISIEVSDIEIANCFFTGTFATSTRKINAVANVENIVITGCFFSLATTSGGPIFNGGPFRNLIFSNNISLRSVNIPNNSTGVFAHNFVQFSSFNIGSTSNFQIHNNIFLNMTTVTLPNAIGNNLSHNIANNSLFGSENNNQTNVPISEIFIVSNSQDGKYQIKEGGAADGKGRDGVDIGPFGGAKPYKLSGLPDIPVIYQLSTGGVANSAGKLPITIKVKAN